MAFLALRVVGVAQTRTGLERMRRRLTDAFQAGQFMVAQAVLTDLLPGVPVDTGELIESRAVTRTMPVQIVFGSPHAIYAHARGARRRWLQVPFSRAAASMAARTAAATTRALAAGWTLSTAPAQHPDTPRTSAPARRARPQRARRRP